MTSGPKRRGLRLPLVAGLTAALAALLVLTACGPSQPVAPVTITDPLGLSRDGVTVSLSYDLSTRRFLGTVPAQTFSDLQASVLPPFTPSSYTLNLAVVGASITGPTAPPSTITLDSPGASVALSDPNVSNLPTLVANGSAGPWTFQETTGGSYNATGAFQLSMSVTDSVTLSQLVQLLTTGGNNTAVVTFGVASSDVPTGDTLVLAFGPGSEVFQY